MLHPIALHCYDEVVDDELGQWPGRRAALDETISIIAGYDMSQMSDPAGKEMMEALSITLISLVINVAKAGPQIKGQPVDLLLLKTLHVQYFQDEVSGISPLEGCPLDLTL